MQNKSSFSESSQEKIREMLQRGAQQSTTDTLPALETLIKIQQSRAKRLEAEAKLLKSALGADHPRVIAADKMAKNLAALKERMDSQLKRVRHLPKLKPNEWCVSGRVLDLTGKPAPGLTVNVLDRDQKYDDLLGESVTDEFGDFYVIYHERDFKEMGENLPELYVVVKNEAGEVLFSSRDNLRYNSGKVEYFLIQLGQKPGPTKKAKARKQ